MTVRLDDDEEALLKRLTRLQHRKPNNLMTYALRCLGEREGHIVNGRLLPDWTEQESGNE